MAVPAGQGGLYQCVVRQGEDFVFAVHEQSQDLTGVYDATADIVPNVPHDFIWAYDQYGRRMDPRYHAGEGGTPIGR